MKYNFKKIEKKWKIKHKKFNFFEINKNSKKKFYILNMFPYPSGYGLHIGHTIGYIFSDIICKYKSGCNYNVLNPIGFDSFGLPAEQYAINTTKHPSYIIKKSIKKYKKQIKNLGVFFNWDKEINTIDKNYYKWTQWIFIKLFNSWYDKKKKKARNIKKLINIYKKKKKWNCLKKKEKNKILNKHRLAYLKNSFVNWCSKLGTVLANDEIKNGKSERGGHKITKKKMLQWHLRITKYSDKLLNGLKKINWPKNIKNSQIKWIGKRKCFYINIKINKKYKTKIFYFKKKKNINNIIINTNSYIYELLIKFIKKKYKKKVINIVKKINNNKNYKILIKTNIINKNKKKINIYISNYKNNKSIKNIYLNVKNSKNFLKIKNKLTLSIKKNFYIKSFFLYFKKKKKIIYNLNDLIFSRQRYWGEPIPIYYIYNIPYNIPYNKLPLKLPYINKYISKYKNYKFKLNFYYKWAWDSINKKIVENKFIDIKKKIYPLETSTMPSCAGSNWYYIRYIDNNNNNKIISNNKEKYWKNVDLYIGGSEHTNGHLLYSRFCLKFLKDIKVINYYNEPFKRFINQGIILNYSFSIFKLIKKKKFISYDLIKKYKKKIQKIYIEKKFIINNNELNINFFLFKNKNYKNFIFYKKKKFLCYKKLEKMSKSKLNIIKPNKIIDKFGIDVFRLYQIFIGPFNKKKIWNLDKIKGIKRFINKLLLIFKNNKEIIKKKPKKEDKIILNNIIKKVYKNYKKLLLHISISYFMKTINIFIKKKIKNKYILEKFIILFSPFAPYISEEIWEKLGHKNSIFMEKQPKIYNIYYKKKIKYIIMLNNKKKFVIKINKVNNNKKYIINKIKCNNNFFYKKKIKKIIFIKNKILNILI
ncbi:MAG: class I tRNA ligase family protein [Candidatus Shikimatogenerans bostrichidophilus]|nr:MAG: class I tRNA ligase family protein [Candidatus Shikimatogenerans bostrichidophilus]